jgi:hypothetical protein
LGAAVAAPPALAALGVFAGPAVLVAAAVLARGLPAAFGLAAVAPAGLGLVAAALPADAPLRTPFVGVAAAGALAVSSADLGIQ